MEKFPFFGDSLFILLFIQIASFSCFTPAFWRFVFITSLDLDTFGLKKSVTLLLLMMLEDVAEVREWTIVSTLMWGKYGKSLFTLMQKMSMKDLTENELLIEKKYRNK